MKISVVSGGFDPIHSGHIAYLEAASQLGDKLIVLLNSDDWLKRKKNREFLPFVERKKVLEALRVVDHVYSFEDDEFGSCINGLKKVQQNFPNDEILFCNGGDRNNNNIPEMDLNGINFVFSVGGDQKLNSSSWILKQWQYPSEERIWGSFFNLYQDKGIKVKELIVTPQNGMSFQRHLKRNEIWLVSQGKCKVYLADDDPDDKYSITLKRFDQLFIPVLRWHQITNPFREECKIIEIQFGKETEESDIERLSYYKN